MSSGLEILCDIKYSGYPAFRDFIGYVSSKFYFSTNFSYNNIIELDTLTKEWIFINLNIGFIRKIVCHDNIVYVLTNINIYCYNINLTKIISIIDSIDTYYHEMIIYDSVIYLADSNNFVTYNIKNGEITNYKIRRGFFSGCNMNISYNLICVNEMGGIVKLYDPKDLTLHSRYSASGRYESSLYGDKLLITIDGYVNITDYKTKLYIADFNKNKLGVKDIFYANDILYIMARDSILYVKN